MPRFQLPATIDDDALEAVIRPIGDIGYASTVSVTATYLDTFDWRLFRAGLVLVEECAGDRRLVLMEAGREPVSAPSPTTPCWPDDLPRGHLADRVGPLLGIRALVTAGAMRLERRDGRIVDAEGNLISRLRIETGLALDNLGNPATEPTTTLRIDSGPATRVFGELEGAEPAAETDLESAAAARGRRPGGYSSKLDIALDPAQPSESAVRTILLDLLGTLERNTAGTIADLDTEFLHDLRVACRRTRSALTQLKGVMPAGVVRPFNDGFKWLGTVTGPLRDLDVYLLEMPVYRSMLPPEAAADLDPLESLIRRSRAEAHRAVVRALRSSRFERLTTEWRELLEIDSVSDEGPAQRPVVELARERIGKAFRRILKKGAKLDADPPAEALHRLRIDAKKLRYLLEFFKNLSAGGEIDARIKELKRLQDILGGFNDMEVQRDRLHEFAAALHGEPATSTETLLTLGRLAGMLEQRQEDFRLAFHDAFVEFSSPTVRNAYDRLFGGRELT
jgi:CHAD domain-containing protein